MAFSVSLAEHGSIIGGPRHLRVVIVYREMALRNAMDSTGVTSVVSLSATVAATKSEVK